MAKRKARKQRKQQPQRQDKQKQQNKLPQDAAEALQQSLIALRRDSVEQVGILVARALELKPTPQQQDAAKNILVEAYFRAAVSNPEKRLEFLNEAININPKIAKVRHYRALALWRDYLENSTNSLEKTFKAILADLDAAYELDPKREGIAYLQSLIRLAFQGEELDYEHLSKDQQAILANAEQFLEKADKQTYLDNGAFPSELWQLLASMQLNGEFSPTQELQKLSQSLRKVGSISQRVRGIINYYLGVAEARQGNLARASSTWLDTKRFNYNSAHLNHNLSQSKFEQAFEAMDEGKWAQAIKLVLPLVTDERIDAKTQRYISEVLVYAHSSIAYEAAQAGNWSQAKQQWQKAMDYSNQRHIAQNLALTEEALNNWGEAALAWRELLKRRPRKESNPEYLTNRQVMVLWQHAAECHLKDPDDYEYEESIHCLKKAVQYADAEDELKLRQRIVDILQLAERYDASENELKRILELDPENMQALLKLATFYEEKDSWWKNSPLPLWKRAYQLDPKNQEAKDGLAKAYTKKLQRSSPKEIGKILAEALEILPNHPQLLVFKAEEAYYKKDLESAIDFLGQAYEAAPEDQSILTMVLGKLVLLDAKKNLKVLLPNVRQVPSISPIFWIHLADDVHEQAIGEQDMPTGRLLSLFGRQHALSYRDLEENHLFWIKTFLDEGIALAQKREQANQHLGEGPIQSKIDAFLFAYESADATKDEELINYYKERITNEFADIGLLEYAEAFTLFDEADDPSINQQVQELLKTAQRKAKKDNHKELIEAAKKLKAKLNSPLRHARIPREVERFLEEFND